MNKGKQYNTKQRQYILECIKLQKDQYVTIQQISDYLKQNELKVGLTTIYRTLDKLEEEGKIAKVSIEGVNAACYRYLEQEGENIFFSMRCEDCGNVMNIECPELARLYEHLSEEHKLQINPGKTMFYGICDDCRKK